VLADFELVWILAGSATWTVQPPGAARHDLLLLPGSLALSRPGALEAYAWDPQRHSAHAFVHFEVGDPTLLAPLETWPLTRSLKEQSVLAGLCDHLLALAQLRSDKADLRSDELLGLLVDLFVTGPLPTRGSAIHSPVVAAALEVVRARWAAHGLTILSVGEVADAVGVSAGHLARTFHAQFHTGIAGALELVRLGSAAVTLQRTNLTLDQVGRAVGYADAYHFSRRFSRAYGMPPGRFRSEPDADPMSPVEHAGLGPLWGATLGPPPGQDQTSP
jgi:AraC-like DNA-binding protein